ncbi:unnamed protein product, partial [Ectocarpus sp. 6 AP-2014]
LAQCIPLKRQRPEGLIGRMAGSDDMYLDFDIDETTVPLEPPQGVSDVQLYQYYVQRIMSAVPRANSLKGRTTEGPVPLRICRVKNQLSTALSKPYGDIHLLKETNHISEEKRHRVAEEAFSSSVAGEAPNSRDGVAAEAVANGSSADGGALARGGHAGGAAGGVEEAAMAAGASTNRTAGGSSSDGAAAAAAATTGALSGQRIFQSFSGPSRAVVTFALYRSAAKGKGLRLPGHLPEKRLFEVEALEHNTLQQIMEAMPPCLTDRIMEERRQGCCGDAQGKALMPPPEPGSSRQKGLALARGFVFIRGVFYVTKPTAGEASIYHRSFFFFGHLDVSDVPPPPPPPASEPEGPRGRGKKGDTAAGLRKKKGQLKGRRRAAAANNRGGAQSDEAQEEEEARAAAAAEAEAAAAAAERAAAAAEVEAAAAAAAAAPPEPWMKRWLQVGGASWDADKEELMKQAEG